MGHHPFINTAGALAVAGLSTVASLLISLWCIYMHLQNYSVPRIQRYIVRILFVCPVYALGSLLSLCVPSAASAMETIRDMMEAFVIYSFLALVLEYAGGDSACVNGMKNEAPLRHPIPFCCLQPIPRDGRFLRLCKQGTLQFVFVKPLMSIISLIMISKGKFDSAGYQASLLVVYNVSYSVALYCLLLFYLATRQLLVHYSPLLKFTAVKSIVFATYWQSLLIRVWSGPADAAPWNNLILCVEMIGFSLFLGLAFSHREYLSGMPDSSVLRNIKEVFSVKDVVQDAYHNFMPTYQDYVLQRGSEGAGRKTFRTRTFLAGNIDHWKLRDHDDLDEHGILDDSDSHSLGMPRTPSTDGDMGALEQAAKPGRSPVREAKEGPRKGPETLSMAKGGGGRGAKKPLVEASPKDDQDFTTINLVSPPV